MASSEQGAPAGAPLDLAPAEAALTRLSNRASPVEYLPRDAYGNLLVVTVDGPKRVEEAVRAGGGDPENVGVVPVSASPLRYDGPCWTAERVSPSDLTGISIQYARGERYLREGSGWVVADGLGTLLMYNEEERLYRLFSHLISRARERRLRHVTGVVPDVLASETLARFRELHDRSVGFE
ncbi:hypothetical protein B4589_011560 [Halolamina sp. CBA1230]|uniref:DUF7504 family protein n=1 Tax=Halolamina sp. CBA1230 TaxID=1853690 RepID=UPI0009A2101A|nr:hypothetical protein [Halolamina sp. CBA1230]QKY20979.1 hypothetical protein B4589_011560 [Halolamina sp. CBA1230]